MQPTASAATTADLPTLIASTVAHFKNHPSLTRLGGWDGMPRNTFDDEYWADQQNRAREILRVYRDRLQAILFACPREPEYLTPVAELLQEVATVRAQLDESEDGGFAFRCRDINAVADLKDRAAGEWSATLNGVATRARVAAAIIAPSSRTSRGDLNHAETDDAIDEPSDGLWSKELIGFFMDDEGARSVRIRLSNGDWSEPNSVDEFQYDALQHLKDSKQGYTRAELDGLGRKIYRAITELRKKPIFADLIQPNSPGGQTNKEPGRYRLVDPRLKGGQAS